MSNKFFEIVAAFKCLGITITNEIAFLKKLEQIRFRRYISVQNFNFDSYLVWAQNLLFYLKGKT